MRLVPYVRPEVPRFFEDFFRGFPVLDGTENQWTPSVDILEKDGNLILRAELPGIDEKAIELKLDGNVLTLRGEKKLEKDEKKGSYHRVESFYGSFSRSFSLPETVDREKIKADFKNGVLTVTIPLKPETKPREIPVSVN